MKSNPFFAWEPIVTNIKKQAITNGGKLYKNKSQFKCSYMWNDGGCKPFGGIFNMVIFCRRNQLLCQQRVQMPKT